MIRATLRSLRLRHDVALHAGRMAAASLMALLLLAAPSPLPAAYDVFWDGGGDGVNFADPNNWNDGGANFVPINGVPNPGDTHNALIGQNFSNTVNLNAPLAAPVDWISVSGNPNTGPGDPDAANPDTDFNINANLTLTNRISAGTWNTGGGVGRINQAAGITVNTGLAFVGGSDVGSAGAKGEYNLAAGATLRASGDIFVGRQGGDGLVINNGGSVETTGGWVYIGLEPGSVGTVVQNGGTLSGLAGDVRLAEQDTASGTLLLNGGTVNAPRVMHTGVNGNGSVFHTDGVVNVGTQFNVSWGGNGTGYYQQDGGTVNVGTNPDVNQDRRALIGYGDNSQGAYVMIGGVMDMRSGMVVGGETGNSSGQFTQTGGHVIIEGVGGGGGGDSGWLHVGHNVPTAPKSLYSMQGGVLDVGTVTAVPIGIGRGGNGEFNQIGGTVNLNGWLLVGDGIGSHSEYNISGGVTNITGPEARVDIGSWNAIDATVRVTGNGKLNNGGSLRVGLNLAEGNDLANHSGTGYVVQRDNGVVDTGALEMGVIGPTSAGFYELHDAASLKVTGPVKIGESGFGNFTQDGGTFEVSPPNPNDSNQWMFIGQNAGSLGTYNLSGGVAIFNTRTHLAGSGGIGIVTQTGGSMTVNHDYFVGDGSGHGEHNISGGSLTATSNLWVGSWETSGSMLISDTDGPTVVSTPNQFIIGGVGYDGLPNRGDVVQTGGAVNAAQLNMAEDTSSFVNTGGPANSSVATYQLQGGSINLTGNALIASHGTATFDQTGGAFNLGPGGTMTIGVAAGSTGAYNLMGGVLDGNGGTLTTGAGVGSFNMTGGVLQDFVTMTVSLNQQSGTLSPGDSPGHMALTGSYSLAAAGTLKIELDGLAPGTQHDQLTVNNGVTLAGTLDVALGFAPPPGSSFLVLENLDDDNVVDPINGAFAGLPEGASFLEMFGPNAYELKITYLGGTGNDVVLSVVPEPSTAVLAAVGLVGLALAIRRRRRAAAWRWAWVRV